MVRPSELPIYEEPEEVLDFEYLGKERTALEENVGVVRKEIEGVLEATRSVRERTVNIYETGKAHTMALVDMMKDLRYSEATVDYITDEENMLPRAGAITIGGLAPGCWGAARKEVLSRKFSTRPLASFLLPLSATPAKLTRSLKVRTENVKDYGTIGYNFVAGVKPQSKVATPVEVKKEAPETAADHVPPVLTPEEPPPPPSETHVPTTEPEGAETGASVKQEGKDVIVQLTPPSPPVETDYGQSNPEDSDMYTTRS
ncbi:MICOS complex subunit MIC27-like [Homarus americanus]|uniref:MICOS complex subunit MIC27-like n=1 Tax=Homarus americanus TaxID=6706 RepID=UPI001C4964E1|nr:MICOS complex subunit MIC27-like [Homarus americanus]